jgi:hypothetical protein
MLRNYELIIYVLILTIGACTPKPPPKLAPMATVFTTNTPITKVILTPTFSCKNSTYPTVYSAILSVSAKSLKVGDSVKVTVTLNNESCVSAGEPEYHLYIESGPKYIFYPNIPERVVHALAVAPGQADTAEFDLRAIASGQATLSATVDYEVNIGDPGTETWYRERSGTGKSLITVVP